MNRSSSRLKVAYLLPTLKVGGAEIQGIVQINALEAEGLQMYPMILSNHITLRDEIRVKSDRIYINSKNTEHLYNTAGIYSVLKALPDLIKFIQENDIKKVVASMNISHFAARMIKMILFFKGYHIKIYIYHHSDFFSINPADTFIKKVMNWSMAVQARFFDYKTLFISHHVQEAISRHTFVKDPVLLYNTVESINISKHINQGRPGNTFKILIPGRVHRVKGQDIFTRAFRNFINEAVIAPSEVQVYIAGEGKIDELKELIASLNLVEYFNFLGVLNKEKLYEAYLSVDLVVVWPQMQVVFLKLSTINEQVFFLNQKIQMI